MADLPSASPTDAEIDRMIERVVRAPSLLNTQPWRFVVERAGSLAVHLYADRSRQLQRLDPDGRELTMSCGAALFYLHIAARHAGWQTDVVPFPAAEDPDLLATVALRPGSPPAGDDRLFRALALRRTNRRPFLDEPVPTDVTAELVEAVAAESASLRVFRTPDEKDALAGLVSAGVLAQGADPALVAEIKAWLRPARDPRRDGVRDSAQGAWDRRVSVRIPASAVAAYKEGLVRDAPAVLVLWTEADRPPDWLQAGQALARALVVAADRGLAASYANEPVEVPALREQVAGLLGGGWPQAVFRVGYPGDELVSPRRPAGDVTERRPARP